jgi:hypothetical protein
LLAGLIGRFLGGCAKNLGNVQFMLAFLLAFPVDVGRIDAHLIGRQRRGLDSGLFQSIGGFGESFAGTRKQGLVVGKALGRSRGAFGSDGALRCRPALGSSRIF